VRENRNHGARNRRPHRQALEKEAEIERLLAEGRDLIGRLTEREFLVAGAALYAGEGTKRDGAVGFANSDPRMIAFSWPGSATSSTLTSRGSVFGSTSTTVSTSAPPIHSGRN
jgi:hypothetical protein